MTISTTRQTDRAVQQHVIDELDWTPDLDIAHIGVAVQHGVVTLTGQVPTYSQRIAARNAALHVLGVTTVADELHVPALEPSRPDDTVLAEAVDRALGSAAQVPAGVTATVRDGQVTLHGEVR